MKRFKNILLLIGQGTENSQTLERPVELAKLNQSRLTVVEDIPKLPAKMKDLLISDSHHGLKEIEPLFHTLKGRPEESIPELAEKERVGLVVMGPVSHTGFAGFIIGNTIERLLRKVNCSVLIVKPEGFVSPVKFKGGGT